MARRTASAATRTGTGAQEQAGGNQSRHVFLVLTFIPVCMMLVDDATGDQWRENVHDDAPNLLSPSACYYIAALLGAFAGYGATTDTNAEVWEVPMGMVCGIIGYTGAVWAGSSYLESRRRGEEVAYMVVVDMITALGALPGLALYAFMNMMLKEPYARRRPKRSTEAPIEETEVVSLLE